jgi:glycosyltransferase involved in cell wall biosynthesis
MDDIRSKNMYGWNNDQLGPTDEKQPSNQKISIVVPTLNHGDTIEHTLLSIINQGDQNYEIIIMDGGSSDNTKDIIDKYRDYITYFESRKDNGQSDAINRGFGFADGDIYAWINSDDYYLPNAFRLVKKTFSENKGIDIVVGSGDVVTKDCQFLKHIKGLEMKRDNLLGWHNDQWIMQQCCFWTAEIWKKSGGVDEDLHLLMDYDLWLRFSSLGRSKAIEDRIAIMRFYKEAKTVALRSRMKEEEAYVYAKNRAFPELRTIVKELSLRNEELTSIVVKYEGSLINKMLRKIGVIK